VKDTLTGEMLDHLLSLLVTPSLPQKTPQRLGLGGLLPGKYTLKSGFVFIFKCVKGS
jgi:hypothetical protein